jgi:hypothetical protein
VLWYAEAPLRSCYRATLLDPPSTNCPLEANHGPSNHSSFSITIHARFFLRSKRFQEATEAFPRPDYSLASSTGSDMVGEPLEGILTRLRTIQQ